MKKTVKLGKGKYFPLFFRLLIIVVLFFIYLVLHENLERTAFIILGIIISPIFPASWNAQKIIEINPVERTLFRYVWVLGKKFGKTESFRVIDGIKLRTFPSRYDPRIPAYHAFLQIDESVKIDLMKSRDKEFLLTNIKKIVDKLDTTIEEIE